MPISAPCDGETPLAFSAQGDYEATPKMQQYGPQRDINAQGGRISANGDLPHEVSIQQICLERVLKALIMFFFRSRDG